MTDWKDNEGMRGYAACSEAEAKAAFRKRYGKQPEKVIKIADEVSTAYYLGPVEDK